MKRISLITCWFLWSLGFSNDTVAAIIPDSLLQYYTLDESLSSLSNEMHVQPLNGAEVNMIPFRRNNQYGFVAKANGQPLFEPQFDKVWAVYAEGAIVSKNDKIGVVSPSGRMLIPFDNFNSVRKDKGIYEYRLIIQDDSVQQEDYNSVAYSIFFNEQGKYLFSETYHNGQFFVDKDTLAWFRYGTEVHIRSKSGRLVKSFKSNAIHPFKGICTNQLVFGREQNNNYYYELISIDGKLLASIPISNKELRGPYTISSSLYGFNTPDGDYYFATKNGLIDYHLATGDVGMRHIGEGFLYLPVYAVMNPDSKKMGLMDSTGKLILPFDYDYLQTGPNRNQYFIMQSGKCSVIDQLGNYLIAPFTSSGLGYYCLMTNESYTFYDGLATLPPVDFDPFYDRENSTTGVQKKYKFNYINTKGDTVLSLSSFYFAGNFHDGLAFAINSNRNNVFINKQGKTVIKLPSGIDGGAEPGDYRIPKFSGDYAYLASLDAYVDRTGKFYYEDAPKTTFAVVESNPEFIGGAAALEHFITTNLQIPNAVTTNTPVTVEVQLTIEKDGTPSKPLIVTVEDSYFTTAALQVIAKMPKWKPAIRNGQAVSTVITIPIVFPATTNK